MQLTFRWDRDKARANQHEHKISFEEAKTLFNDPLLLTYPDDEHSVTEERYVSIGGLRPWQNAVGCSLRALRDRGYVDYSDHQLSSRHVARTV